MKLKKMDQVQSLIVNGQTKAVVAEGFAGASTFSRCLSLSTLTIPMVYHFPSPPHAVKANAHDVVYFYAQALHSITPKPPPPTPTAVAVVKVCFSRPRSGLRQLDAEKKDVADFSIAMLATLLLSTTKTSGRGSLSFKHAPPS
jgi:hypothetical protein